MSTRARRGLEWYPAGPEGVGEEPGKQVRLVEPRTASDAGARQIEAGRRILEDLGQVLGGFRDCIVVVGGKPGGGLTGRAW